jgi:non-ribosomal peptide synthetase component E (peptide arylation enzyme)
VERRKPSRPCWRAGWRATPDREALTDGTHRLSYRELAHGIDRMAARLRALGIGPGTW